MRTKKGITKRGKKTNIFNGFKNPRIFLSDHFLERWNERINDIKFETKYELRNYIERNYNNNHIEHLHGDHYLMGDMMGGLYITARKVKDGIFLITTLGTYKDNPVIYNIITSGEMDEIFKRYGKIELNYAA